MTRQYKKGQDREEVLRLPPRLDDFVSADNPVRAIDAYVETLDLTALGFDRMAPNRTAAGQPPFPPQALLKLYLYGYVNRVRSSRGLERECQRNLEVIWLIQGLRPSYRTLADFRQRNAKALRQVHVEFIGLCKALRLLGGEQVAVDGSHFNGNVSDHSFHSVKGLKQDLERLDQRIEAWLAELDQADREDLDAPAYDSELPAKLEKLKDLKARKQLKEETWQALEAVGETQVSTTDPDARLLYKKGQTIAGYNVQIVVDAQHKLIVTDDLVQDGNDVQQLQPMLSQAKAVLEVDQSEGLADKGYFNPTQIAQCEAEGIAVYVPEPANSGQQRQAGRFLHEDFQYQAEADCYRCPHGETLRPRGQPRLQDGSAKQRYVASATACRECPLKAQCLAPKSRYREVWRNEHQTVLEAHRQRMQARPGIMRKRSALVEHPFGTLKCRAGWNHFLLRGLVKVRGEWSLMALAYNFTRVLNVLGFQGFRDGCAQNAAGWA